MPRISQIFRHMALSTSSITHQEELPLMEIRKQKIISQLAEDLLQLFSCLPDEIIIEILLRLPVKSLLKLRCVSKSWLSVLSSPQFINTQIKFSAKESKNVNLRLVVVASVSGLGRMCSIYSIVCGNSSLNAVKIDYPLKAPLGSAKILGSCNGLICLTAASCKLILWNPATGKYNEFQDSFVHGGGGCFIRYGFGYDELTDDYKVVKMFSYRRDEGKHENMVKVYSSRANSWTMIEGFNSGYINGQLGLFVNGTLHWDVCHNRDSNGSWEIMTFNLATNMFGVMELPSCGKGDCSWTLSASGGHLVACCNYDSDKTDIWVMKEYGVENSWTKSVSLTSPVDRRGHILPLFVSENGDEVIVKLGTYISLYNSKNASYYALENHPSGYCLQVQAVTYIESLASPDVY